MLCITYKRIKIFLKINIITLILFNHLLKKKMMLFIFDSNLWTYLYYKLSFIYIKKLTFIYLYLLMIFNLTIKLIDNININFYVYKLKNKVDLISLYKFVLFIS